MDVVLVSAGDRAALVECRADVSCCLVRSERRQASLARVVVLSVGMCRFVAVSYRVEEAQKKRARERKKGAERVIWASRFAWCAWLLTVVAHCRSFTCVCFGSLLSLSASRSYLFS